ncbi:hypothetical protein [Magnetospirillum fulvum]|nr:hypothetical protein [Magnetospirillum fulvum]
METPTNSKDRSEKPASSRLPSLEDVSSPDFARKLTEGFRQAVSHAVDRQHAAGIEVYHLGDEGVDVVPPPKAARKTR